MSADDLQADWQSALAKSGRHRRRRLSREVEREGKGQPLERRDDMAIDLLRALDVKLEGRHCERRR